MRGKWRLPVANGQASIEAISVIPLLGLTVLLIVQLLWLVFAQSTFNVAVAFAVRAGSLNHGSTQVVERTLSAGMASLRPQYVEGMAPPPEQLRVAHWRATIQQYAHAQWASKIIVHQPTAEQLKTQVQRRYDLVSAAWLNELAVDHPQLRQRESVMELEIWWCLPLHVPFAAQVLTQLRNWWDEPAQRFCALREEVSGQPLWALQQRLSQPLLSGYREGLND